MDTPADGVLFASYNVHKCVGTDRRFDPGAHRRGDRRDRRRRARAAGDRPPLRRPRRPARPRRDRARRRPRAGAGRERPLRPRLARQPRAGARGAVPRRAPGRRCRGSSRAARWSPISNSRPGAVRVVAAHLGLLRHSRRLQVERLLGHAAEASERPDRADGRPQRMAPRPALGAARLRAELRPADARARRAFRPISRCWRSTGSSRGPAAFSGRSRAHDTPLARKASDHLPIKARVRLGGPALTRRIERRRHACATCARPVGRAKIRALQEIPIMSRRFRACSRPRAARRLRPRGHRPRWRRSAGGVGGSGGARPTSGPRSKFPGLSRVTFEKADLNGDGVIEPNELPVLQSVYQATQNSTLTARRRRPAFPCPPPLRYRGASQDREAPAMSQASANVNVMIKAARKAARSLLRDFGEVENLQVSTKGPGDFVSQGRHQGRAADPRGADRGAARTTAGSARRASRSRAPTRPGAGSSIRSTAPPTSCTACRTGRSRSGSSTRARSSPA